MWSVHTYAVAHTCTTVYPDFFETGLLLNSEIGWQPASLSNAPVSAPAPIAQKSQTDTVMWMPGI